MYIRRRTGRTLETKKQRVQKIAPVYSDCTTGTWANGGFKVLAEKCECNSARNKLYMTSSSSY
jgi:hypothetical protein